MKSNKKNRHSPTLNILLLSLVAVVTATVLYVANTLIQKPQVFEINASSGRGELLFVPDVVTLNLADAPQTVTLWVSVDHPLAFAHATLRFDPSLLKLTEPPKPSKSQLSKIIKESTLIEANQSGVYTFAYGILPTDRANAPSGSFKLASFKITPTTSAHTKTTSLTVESDTQLVDSGAQPITVTPHALTFTLNPPPSLAPTPTPQATFIPAPSPSSSQPASTPQPTVSPNSAPTLTLTRVKSWGRRGIKAVATDSDRIGSIEFTIGNTILKKCRRNTSCTYIFPRNLTSPQVIRVVATDRSPQRQQSSELFNY